MRIEFEFIVLFLPRNCIYNILFVNNVPYVLRLLAIFERFIYDIMHTSTAQFYPRAAFVYISR